MEIKNKWMCFGSGFLLMFASHCVRAEAPGAKIPGAETSSVTSASPGSAPPAPATPASSSAPATPAPIGSSPPVETAPAGSSPPIAPAAATPAPAPVPSASGPNVMTSAKPLVSPTVWPELLLPSTPPGNASAGQAKSQVCAACHGPDGNSTVPAWPKIAGQSDLYLVKSLIEYRKGDKGNRFEPSMFAMVQNLSDQDIADLAAYFASQTMSPGTVPASLVSLGEKIYRGGNLATGVPACAACHGAEGEGNNLAKFPRLSGQHPDYTLDQLKKFKAKMRKDDPNGIMQDISQRLSDEEMKAVSSYVSGLH